MAEHRDRGDTPVLVTGSIDFIMAPLASELGIQEVIAPSLLEKDGAFSGKLDGPPIGGKRRRCGCGGSRSRRGRSAAIVGVRRQFSGLADVGGGRFSPRGEPGRETCGRRRVARLADPSLVARRWPSGGMLMRAAGVLQERSAIRPVEGVGGALPLVEREPSGAAGAAGHRTAAATDGTLGADSSETGGVCRSDLATLSAKESTYLSPLISLPFVMGHEVVGVVSEIGRGSRRRVGDRVVVHPALGCTARGVTPRCDSCRDERGRAVPQRDPRGRVGRHPDRVLSRYGRRIRREPGGTRHKCTWRAGNEDRAAVLIEPFACALHGAARASVPTEGTALVLGCGAIGLLTIAALRATGCKARIVAAAKYDHQGRAALALGADEWLPSSGRLAARYARWAEALSADVPSGVGQAGGCGRGGRDV